MSEKRLREKMMRERKAIANRIPGELAVEIRMRCIEAATRMVKRSSTGNEKHLVVNVAELFERHVFFAEPVDVLTLEDSTERGE
jgi:hypothetical protein